jgi:hypothetical protein
MTMAKHNKDTNHFVENDTPPDLVASPDLYEASNPVGVMDSNQDSLADREQRDYEAAQVASGAKANADLGRDSKQLEGAQVEAAPRDLKGFIHELEELNRRTLVGRDMRPELHDLIARLKKQA